MTDRVVVVGASQAGIQIAATLRERGFDGDLTLVGYETGQPYQKPPLSKDFLTGEADEKSLAFRTSEFWDQQRIRLFSGERVLLARLNEDGTGVATTGQGRELPFDHLALGVGARPRRLDVPGATADGVAYLRSVRDARSLRRRLAEAERVVVVGGGFIGLEAAAVARAQGKTVTIVETLDRLMSRSVAPVVSEFCRQAHERRGVDVRLGAGVAAIRSANGGVTGVELTDGSVVDADLVLVGIGVIPRTELAVQLGLEIDGGIVVDEFARTSKPTVVAAGDCTVQPHPLTGNGMVRLESVQNAVSQGRVAAATIMGNAERYMDVPWFWSDQYDLKLQIAGLSRGYDHFVVRGRLDDESFSVLYYQQGRLCGVDAVNRAVDYMVVRQALGRGATIPADRAGDDSVKLKALVVDAVPTDTPAEVRR